MRATSIARPTARQPLRRAVGRAIEVARTAGQRVQHLLAIVDIVGVEDEGRIGRPEQDAPAPQIGPPGGLADDAGMAIEPPPHQVLGHRRAFAPGGRRRQIAQPGEAMQVIGEGGREAAAAERLDHHRFAAVEHSPLEQSTARTCRAGDRIGRHVEQLHRIAPAQPQFVKRRAP